ncbi:hypothetical protein [Amycolatopsis circi]|uniref:hypothetical protein n=1 Tax=Amycolatopsis circi TaxID=871959 RepID=UPI000E2285B7|nr:hypothetical protein [Amycolatopsis circi]
MTGEPRLFSPVHNSRSESSARTGIFTSYVMTGAVLLAIGVYFVSSEVHMSWSGVTTLATVDRVDYRKKQDIASITFDDSKGHRLPQQSIGVDRDVYAGGRLAVIYLPDDPSSVELVASREFTAPVAAGVAVLGAALLFWEIQSLWLRPNKRIPTGPPVAEPRRPQGRASLASKSDFGPVRRPMGKRERRRTANR